MANAPEGPRQCGTPPEDEHQERGHGEKGHAAAEEVCAPSDVRDLSGDVPPGCRHRRGVAADGAALFSDRSLPFRVGVLSSHIRVTEPEQERERQP